MKFKKKKSSQWFDPNKKGFIEGFIGKDRVEVVYLKARFEVWLDVKYGIQRRKIDGLSNIHMSLEGLNSQPFKLL